MAESKLMRLFREKINKSKSTDIKEADFDVLYKSGFLSLDFINGTLVHINGNGMDSTYNSVGLMDGSATTFIGRSGCGKSTLVVQIIGNLLKQFPDSSAYIDDIEGSLPMSRKEFLLGLSEEELRNRVFFRNTGITTENVYEQIRSIYDIKMENKKDFEYDTGLYDIYGNRIYKLIPTFYFIDSLALLMPDEVMQDDDLGSNMTGSSVAKQNTALIKKISQLLKGANIMLFSINHILDDIQIGFIPKPQQIAGLKQGERLPGGRTMLYLANNMFRLDEKGLLKEAEGYGINGSIVDITIVKSRTNASRRSVPLIFDKSNGAFDNELSLLHLLKTEGLVNGAAKSVYINTDPDAKFSFKTFKQDLRENSNLQVAFATAVKTVLENMLSDTKVQERSEEEFDINKMI